MESPASSLFFESPPVPKGVLALGEEREYAPKEMMIENNSLMKGCFLLTKDSFLR